MYKNKLKEPMIQLCKELQTKVILESFFDKSMFNGGEVNYLTVLLDNYFHIFAAKDVTNTLTNGLLLKIQKQKLEPKQTHKKFYSKIKLMLEKLK